jgi:hypothetical protein
MSVGSQISLLRLLVTLLNPSRQKPRYWHRLGGDLAIKIDLTVEFVVFVHL